MGNEKSLFTLEVDGTGKSHLKDAAKWAKFLAVAGFITLGFIVVLTVFFSIATHKKTVQVYDDGNAGTGELIGSIVAAAIFAVIYFFPCYFLLRFASKMSAAIQADDTASLNESFKNLKMIFRYTGVITIIFLVFFIIGMLGSL